MLSFTHAGQLYDLMHTPTGSMCLCIGTHTYLFPTADQAMVALLHFIDQPPEA